MKLNTCSFLFSRDLNPAERIDLLEIKYDLRNVTLAAGEEDGYEGDCSAKALYAKLTESEPDWEYKRILQNKLIPPKIPFLVWASLHDSVPTRSMLQHRGMIIHSNLCVYCDEEEESAARLFLNCSWASYVWNMFLSSLQIPWASTNDIKNLLLSWRVGGVSQRKKFFWQILLFAIIWMLWLERNSRVHGGRSKSKDELVKAVKSNICMWSMDTNIFRDFSMDK
ncbi:uncharacterized protein LOC113305647 [Papaver somniferum]|uniref:uncharacterized protein LOC113305647 n=1 Tax=Papaver somniferum TaxID=3469 RepID=UPI000E703D65|nr:uncharacterized protein LOC113305647 [Papaver somniferum]